MIWRSSRRLKRRSAAARVEVAHVTTAHAATDNRIVRKECRALADAGVDVVLVARGPVVAETAVRHIPLPLRRGRLRRMLLGPLDAWLVLDGLRPRLVHVHDPELVPLALAYTWSGRGRAVYDAHEELSKQVWGKAYLPRWARPPLALACRALEKLADRSLDGVVAATPVIAAGYSAEKVTVVQNFPWLREYPIAVAPSAPDVDLVYVGGLSEGRGAREMVALVRERGGPAASMLVAGPTAGPHIDRMLAEVQSVTNLGACPAEEVPAIVSRGRIGLVLLHPLPNYLEAQPTKLFEYMAAGIPFIASDFPFWRSLLDGVDCCIFVDPLDVEALRAAVSDLLADEDRRAAMGRAGRRALQEMFTFEAEATRLVTSTRALIA